MALSRNGYMQGSTQMYKTFIHELGHCADYSLKGTNKKVLNIVDRVWATYTQGILNSGSGMDKYMTNKGAEKVGLNTWTWFIGKENKYNLISAYSTHNRAEFFAEAVRDYVLNRGDKIKNTVKSQKLYDMIKNVIFGGREF